MRKKLVIRVVKFEKTLAIQIIDRIGFIFGDSSLKEFILVHLDNPPNPTKELLSKLGETDLDEVCLIKFNSNEDRDEFKDMLLVEITRIFPVAKSLEYGKAYMSLFGDSLRRLIFVNKHPFKSDTNIMLGSSGNLIFNSDRDTFYAVTLTSDDGDYIWEETE